MVKAVALLFTMQSLYIIALPLVAITLLLALSSRLKMTRSITNSHWTLGLFMCDGRKVACMLLVSFLLDQLTRLPLIFVASRSLP